MLKSYYLNGNTMATSRERTPPPHKFKNFVTVEVPPPKSPLISVRIPYGNATKEKLIRVAPIGASELILKESNLPRELARWLQESWKKGRPQYPLPCQNCDLVVPEINRQIVGRTVILRTNAEQKCFPIFSMPGRENQGIVAHIRIGGLFAVIPDAASGSVFVVPPQRHLQLKDLIPGIGYSRVQPDGTIIDYQDTNPVGGYTIRNLREKAQLTKYLRSKTKEYTERMGGELPIVVPEVLATPFEDQPVAGIRLGVFITKEPDNQISLVDYFRRAPPEQTQEYLAQIYFLLGETLAWLHNFAEIYHLQLNSNNLTIIPPSGQRREIIMVVRDLETAHRVNPFGGRWTPRNTNALRYWQSLAQHEMRNFVFSQLVIPVYFLRNQDTFTPEAAQTILDKFWSGYIQELASLYPERSEEILRTYQQEFRPTELSNQLTKIVRMLPLQRQHVIGPRLIAVIKRLEEYQKIAEAFARIDQKLLELTSGAKYLAQERKTKKKRKGKKRRKK